MVNMLINMGSFGNMAMRMLDNTIFVTTEEEELRDGRKRFKRFFTCFGPLKKRFGRL